MFCENQLDPTVAWSEINRFSFSVHFFGLVRDFLVQLLLVPWSR